MTTALDGSVSARVATLDRNPRGALIAFGVALAVAVPFLLWFGRAQWFFLDEWDFLVERSAFDLDDLLRPHNEHWVTLPILLYRALWSAVGLDAYWPYQLLAVTNHLAIAALLRVVMRRAGAAPWIATLLAGLFVFFGAGAQNALWAFQITFAGPIVLGLVHLLLADHDGDLDRRDWWGLLAGLGALMCSGNGAVMIAVVGLAVLTRRGWRPALFHTVPLVVIDLVWFEWYGREGLLLRQSSSLETLEFAWEGLTSTFHDLGRLPGAGLTMAAVLVVGTAEAIRSRGWSRTRSELAGALSLLIGGCLFLLAAGWGRAWVVGPEGARASRYVHVAAALLLPALAVAIDALYRRWRWVGWAALVASLVGAPGNVRDVVRYDEVNASFLGSEDLVLGLAHSEWAADVPPTLRPFPEFARQVTTGWLLDGIAAGRVPGPDGDLDPVTQSTIRLRLALLTTPVDPPLLGCRALTGREDRRIKEGDSFVIRSGVLLITELVGGRPSGRVRLTGPVRVDALAGPLEVRIEPSGGSGPVGLCD